MLAIVVAICARRIAAVDTATAEVITPSPSTVRVLPALMVVALTVPARNVLTLTS